MVLLPPRPNPGHARDMLNKTVNRANKNSCPPGTDCHSRRESHMIKKLYSETYSMSDRDTYDGEQ